MSEEEKQETTEEVVETTETTETTEDVKDTVSDEDKAATAVEAVYEKARSRDVPPDETVDEDDSGSEETESRVVDEHDSDTPKEPEETVQDVQVGAFVRSQAEQYGFTPDEIQLMANKGTLDATLVAVARQVGTATLKDTKAEDKKDEGPKPPVFEIGGEGFDPEEHDPELMGLLNAKLKEIGEYYEGRNKGFQEFVDQVQARESERAVANFNADMDRVMADLPKPWQKILSEPGAKDALQTRMASLANEAMNSGTVLPQGKEGYKLLAEQSMYSLHGDKLETKVRDEITDKVTKRSKQHLGRAAKRGKRELPKGTERAVAAVQKVFDDASGR